eukprot:TRINITY_DN19908_c0_g1_i1.p1 TRINITY_DN19908_c0_g1~~TRINITY_DN19908_c0_g1_i1.p1  ORF type:complete len:652 (-),score=118.43 TRINITY_DN19908_c0_g1_i1:759-2714(-)
MGNDGETAARQSEQPTGGSGDPSSMAPPPSAEGDGMIPQTPSSSPAYVADNTEAPRAASSSIARGGGPAQESMVGVSGRRMGLKQPSMLRGAVSITDLVVLGMQAEEAERLQELEAKRLPGGVSSLSVQGQGEVVRGAGANLSDTDSAGEKQEGVAARVLNQQQQQQQAQGASAVPKSLSLRTELDAESVLLEASPSSTATAEGRADDRRRSSFEAEGVVAAGGVADRQFLGPHERRRLAIVMVGLPARGKTFTAAKLARYLRWLGHETKHFNVGKYRRVKLNCTQNSDFFHPDNTEGLEARNEVARAAFLDMLEWMEEEGGQVGVFDATNSNSERRRMLLEIAEGRCKMIFLECICTDASIIEQNVQEKIRTSPDYTSTPDRNEALADFKARLANYEKVYEPVSEGSYIKLIDMVSGGGQIQVNNISGYLPGRIVFFLVNSHTTPRPIILTRHGESQDNVRGRIGGDSALSERGEKYATKLAEFVTKRLGGEERASIWTSTLQRTVLTARHIHNFPKVQWRVLDEINAGNCDGMTYEEIKQSMPDDHRARAADKLRYRYPRGESYLDVIQRLEPVIIEVERQRAPVVIVAHQAVLRALYAYFMDRPLRDIPHIEVPLHTIIELTTGVGVSEKRIQLFKPGEIGEGGGGSH